MWSLAGNATESAHPVGRWQPEPTRRGTFNILSTCLVTLVLCFWTVVHLNIPEHRMAKRQVLHKLKWLLMALMAPEVIAFSAFHQWYHARKLDSEVRGVLDGRSGPGKVPLTSFWRKLCFWSAKSGGAGERIPLDPEAAATDKIKDLQLEWSRVHAYYALMGGYAFEIPSTLPNFGLPDRRSRLTLTARGLLFLIKHHRELVPHISKEYILDKSNASYFTKVLVWLQAFWFCLQIISRLGLRLSITLLELATFAHAIFAVCTYLLWWHKPLDIQEPTLIPIKDELTRKLCAAMYARSRMGYCMAASPNTKLAVLEFDIDVPAAEETALPPPHESIDAALGSSYQISQSAGTGYSVLTAQESHAAITGAEGPREEETVPLPTIEVEAYGEAPELVPLGRSYSTGAESTATTTPNSIPGTPKLPPPGLRLKPGNFAQGIGFRYVVEGTKNLESDYYPTKYGIPKNMVVHLRPEAAALFQLAGATVADYSELRPSPVHIDADGAADKLSSTADFVVSRVKNLESVVMLGNKRLKPGGDSTTTYAMALFSTFYGALHLLAWDAPFRTRTEMLMWRISAVAIMSAPALLSLQRLVVGLSWEKVCDAMDALPKRFPRGRLHTLAKRVKWFWDHTFGSLVGIGLWGLVWLCFIFALSGCYWVYIFGRVYLVVESFINLPFVPESVFELPQWSAYFPHIS